MESHRIEEVKSRFFELKHFNFTEKDLEDATNDLERLATSFEGVRKGKVSPATLEFIDKIQSEEFRNLIIKCICYPSLITFDAYDIRMLLKDADKTMLIEAKSIKEIERKIKAVKNVKEVFGILIYINCASDINLEEFSNIGYNIPNYIKKNGEIVIGARISGLPEGKRKFYALLCWAGEGKNDT